MLGYAWMNWQWWTDVGQLKGNGGLEKKKKICSQKLDKVFNMSKIKKLIKYLLYLA